MDYQYNYYYYSLFIFFFRFDFFRFFFEIFGLSFLETGNRFLEKKIRIFWKFSFLETKNRFLEKGKFEFSGNFLFWKRKIDFWKKENSNFLEIFFSRFQKNLNQKFQKKKTETKKKIETKAMTSYESKLSYPGQEEGEESIRELSEGEKKTGEVMKECGDIYDSTKKQYADTDYIVGFSVFECAGETELKFRIAAVLLDYNFPPKNIKLGKGDGCWYVEFDVYSYGGVCLGYPTKEDALNVFNDISTRTLRNNNK